MQTAANTEATATTDEISKAITDELLTQGCTRVEMRGWRYELREPSADYDSSEDGSPSWYWSGIIVDEDGEKVAEFLLPDWYLEAVEIVW